MKKLTAIILSAVLLLSACGNAAVSISPAAEDLPQSAPNAPAPSAEELAQVIIIDSGRGLDTVQYVNENYDADMIPGYVEGFYGLASEVWSECAVYRAAAADDAFEISVFKLTEQAELASVFNELEEYRHARQGDFFGYNPEQAEIVDKGIVSISSDGVWAAVLICSDPARAEEAFYARLSLTLPESGNEDPDGSTGGAELSAEELALAVLLDNGLSIDSMQRLNDSFSDAESMAGYVQGSYLLTPSEWTQCSIYRAADSAEAYEISIFKLSSQAEPNIVLYNLENYRQALAKEFAADARQAELINSAAVCISSNGVWTAIFVCPDPERAEEAFNSMIGMSPDGSTEPPTGNGDGFPDYWLPYTDPNIDDMTLWDNSALVAALKAGSDDGLDAYGKKLYKKADKVIKKVIDEGMSAIEKEEAIYRWLTDNCEYDFRHYEVPNNAPRESYEPYGAIVEGTAVCLGFATAFQLFMDVLDIECITVVGAAFNSMEDHAWNMVKIDGEWYCVDATWDAGAYGFGYFNVSSDYMAMTGHQWEYDKYPLSLAEGDGEWADVIWVPVE